MKIKEYQGLLINEIKIKGQVVITFKSGELHYLEASLKLLDKNDDLIMNKIDNKTYQFKLKGV